MPPIKPNVGIVVLIEFLDCFKKLGYDISSNDLEGLMSEIKNDINSGKLIKRSGDS